jgi:hypothetical protein
VRQRGKSKPRGGAPTASRRRSSRRPQGPRAYWVTPGSSERDEGPKVSHERRPGLRASGRSVATSTGSGRDRSTQRPSRIHPRLALPGARVRNGRGSIRRSGFPGGESGRAGDSGVWAGSGGIMGGVGSGGTVSQGREAARRYSRPSMKRAVLTSSDATSGSPFPIVARQLRPRPISCRPPSPRRCVIIRFERGERLRPLPVPERQAQERSPGVGIEPAVCRARLITE